MTTVESPIIVESSNVVVDVSSFARLQGNFIKLIYVIWVTVCHIAVQRMS
jgi:hypothetical protein